MLIGSFERPEIYYLPCVYTQKAGNCISEPLDFTNFWKNTPQTPPGEKGLKASSTAIVAYSITGRWLQLKFNFCIHCISLIKEPALIKQFNLNKCNPGIIKPEITTINSLKEGTNSIQGKWRLHSAHLLPGTINCWKFKPVLGCW